MIKLFVKGIAKREIDKLQNPNIEGVFKALRENCKKSTAALLDEFNARTRESNESLVSYSFALETLHAKVMPDLDANLRNQIIISKLLESASNEMRTMIKISKLTDFAEVAKLMDESGIEGERTTTSNEIKSEAVELNKFSSEKRVRFNDERRLNKNKFDGNCNFCGKYGHKKSECFKLTRKIRDERQTSRWQKESRRERLNERREENNFNFNHQKEQKEISNKIIKAIASKSEIERVGLLRADVLLSLDDSSSQIMLKTLIDSGATHSIIRLNALPIEIQEAIKSNRLSTIRRSELKLVTATGEEEANCMIGEFKIKMNNWIGQHEFLIMENLKSEDAIIGRDFLKKYRVNVDHSSDTISINVAVGFENDINLNSSSDQSKVEKADIKLKTDEKIIVPARSEMIILTKVDSKIGDGDLLFDPKQQQSGLILAKSVAKIFKEKIPVQVINMNEHEIELKQNTEIGTVYEINSYKDNAISNTIEIKKSASADGEKMKKIEINPALNNEQREQLNAVIDKHANAFKWSEDEPFGRTNLVEHKIETNGAKPVRIKQFRIPHSYKPEIANQVNKMLEQNIIRESNSPWTSPIMIVEQENDDGSTKYRFCIDFRQLNKVTRRDCYPLPRIDETLECLSGAKFFSKLDLASGFWQIPLAEEDKEKTAFVANNNLYEFNVMPFGLTNAPSTFQRLIDTTLKGLTWQQCLVYIDDVIIFSTTFEQHLMAIEQVLERIESANLKLQARKCHFCMREVSYLGYLITADGLKPDPRRVSKIIEMQLPADQKALMRFIGAMSYYRRFIPNFSKTASILHRMIESKEKFAWNDDAKVAFEKLKHHLVEAPILIYPNFNEQFYIETDASDYAIGAILTQKKQRKSHPIAYASRHLTKTERNYSAIEREMLALIWAFDHFNAYVHGKKVIFITDHEPLASAKRLKNPSGRLARMFNKLQAVEYEIVYRPGQQNEMADMLSRLNHLEIKSTIDWGKEQRNDPNIRKIIELKKTNKLRESKMKSLEEWKRIANNLLIEKEILYYKAFKTDKRVVVPTHMIHPICSLYHDAPIAGHLGVDRMHFTMIEKYYWLRMKESIQKFYESCPKCQAHKSTRIMTAPLKPIEVSQPWQTISIDFTGPFKPTRNGNKNIIVAIDYFSKFAIAAATRDATAETTAKFVFDEIICKFGSPVNILSDQGRNFEANLFKELVSMLGINKLRTTSYHPQGNGLVERLNRTIKRMLTMYVNDNHNNWDVFLQQNISAYNNTPQSSTKISPYELIFGKKPRTLLDQVGSGNAAEANAMRNPSDYLSEIMRNKQKLVEIANENLQRARRIQQKYYNKWINSSSHYKVGDLILLTNERKRVGHSAAFEPKQIGPFVITKILNEHVYQVKNIYNDKISNVNYNRMRHFNCRNDETSVYHPNLNIKNESIEVNSAFNFDVFELLLWQLAESTPEQEDEEEIEIRIQPNPAEPESDDHNRSVETVILNQQPSETNSLESEPFRSANEDGENDEDEKENQNQNDEEIENENDGDENDGNASEEMEGNDEQQNQQEQQQNRRGRRKGTKNAGNQPAVKAEHVSSRGRLITAPISYKE
jgi:hypothetical protein